MTVACVAGGFLGFLNFYFAKCCLHHVERLYLKLADVIVYIPLLICIQQWSAHKVYKYSEHVTTQPNFRPKTFSKMNSWQHPPDLLKSIFYRDSSVECHCLSLQLPCINIFFSSFRIRWLMDERHWGFAYIVFCMFNIVFDSVILCKSF